MITIEQIKAARGLLDWTQGDLAKATGLSLAALNNIERRAVMPRTSTLQIIEQALMRGGVEFTEGPGVRVKGEPFEFQKFEGEDFLMQHTHDIIASTRENDFFYACSWSEKQIVDHSKEVDDLYQKNIADKKIDERIIVPEGLTVLTSRREHYRCLPPAALGRMHWMVYGDKLAFDLWEKPYRAVIIRNATLAEAYKKQFLFLWGIAKKLK